MQNSTHRSASCEKWRHNEFPWPYLKFCDFSRFTKFPVNARFVETLIWHYIVWTKRDWSQLLYFSVLLGWIVSVV